MKLGLISDIHGDIAALERAWALLQELGAERIVCAGDVVGYGPEPDRVVAFLAERSVPVVKGNHDRWALEREHGEPDQFGGGMPSAETLSFLKELPGYLLVSQERRVGVVAHGSPWDDMEFVTRRTHPPAILRELLEVLKVEFLVVGHTHEPMWYRCEQGLVVNPGSVIALPVVQSSRSLAIVDCETLEPAFYEVETGRVLRLEPWEEDDEDEKHE